MLVGQCRMRANDKSFLRFDLVKCFGAQPVIQRPRLTDLPYLIPDFEQTGSNEF